MTRKPLHGDDYVFESPPDWLPDPLRKVASDLTYDEAHALELGAVAGLVFGVAIATGYTDVAVPLLVLSVAAVLGLKRAPNNRLVAQRVTRNEPWYYGLALAAGLIIAILATPLVL
ncbi:hypothetical protein ACFPYI_01965 [Halomarina salina]|uniref:DUF4190 domain-containing protein n=1 Tax=Halomarina salina TaxID=1872699 RepID=A0ABD5RHS2_9EURY|nr:hypothetical protein [Halomarina salina]